MKKITETEDIPELDKYLTEIPAESGIFVAKSMQISKRIFQSALAHQWMQKDLAEKMGKTEPEISKLLSGTHNYTLRTLSKIEAVLGHEIITVPGFCVDDFSTSTNLNGFFAFDKFIKNEDSSLHEPKAAKIIPIEKDLIQEEISQAS